MSDDKKLKEFRVIETATIIREGYIEAESLEEAEAIVDSDDYFNIDMEITEEYTDNIEVWEDWQVFKRTENNLKKFLTFDTFCYRICFVKFAEKRIAIKV